MPMMGNIREHLLLLGDAGSAVGAQDPEEINKASAMFEALKPYMRKRRKHTASIGDLCHYLERHYPAYNHTEFRLYIYFLVEQRYLLCTNLNVENLFCTVNGFYNNPAAFGWEVRLP